MVRLTINGVEQSLDIDPDTPLLWALREPLDMRGTKFGCGIGVCGACTVIVDGEQLRSCTTPVSAVEGSRIETIESASSDALGRRVQQAWLDHDVSQCGYCQPGMIMAAIAVLRSPDPVSQAQVESQITNICRCGTYTRIRLAIADLIEART